MKAFVIKEHIIYTFRLNSVYTTEKMVKILEILAKFKLI